MKCSVLQIGTQIATDARDSSENGTHKTRTPRTLADLLEILGEIPPREFPMLRSTCSMLGTYLDKPVDQITIDSVNESRSGFRPFLESRTYAENSIRTYVNHVRILLKSASEFGWKPDDAVPEQWRGVLALAGEKKCADVAKYLARIRKTPHEITIEDVDHWAYLRVQQGISYEEARRRKALFWRLLRDCGCTEQTPMCIVREKNYGVPLEQFPSGLKKEVLELLRWKQAEYSVDRPKGARHRPVTAKRLEELICQVLGFATNVCGKSEAVYLPAISLPIVSLTQLVDKQIIGGYVEWSINERKVKGASLQRNLRLLVAAMRQHPSYKAMDLSWVKPLLDSVPTESKAVVRRRKSEKSLDYTVVESIPVKIRAERLAATKNKKGANTIARLAMEELLITWMIPLPWRQRNLRECRINGPEPNLFKRKIPPFLDIDKPEWVQLEEQKNPESEFWQFRFKCEETKTGTRTGIEINCVLPRPLIGLLEQYLKEFRPHLLDGADPGTLFVNEAGKPLTLAQMTIAVSHLTLRHGGRRVTPHLFRDIVAFAWLKAHPKDYLTLSKILWHSDIKTTIEIYGSEFNASCGVVAMESWLEERQAKSKVLEREGREGLNRKE